jgi:hypothetical protein
MGGGHLSLFPPNMATGRGEFLSLSLSAAATPSILDLSRTALSITVSSDDF